MATTWSERIEAQGIEKGLQMGRREGEKAGRREGLQEGRQMALQAVRKVLLSLLEQRFGPLSEATRERVESISSLDRLTRLSERALTARSLAALRLH